MASKVESLIEIFANNNPYLARKPEMQAEKNGCTCFDETTRKCPIHGANRPPGVLTYPRRKSAHQQLVESFMVKARQDVPQTPTIPDEKTRLLRAKLILEECLETIEALGVHLDHVPADYDDEGDDCSYLVFDGEFLRLRTSWQGKSCPINLQEVVDGCCDIKVVTTGTLSAFGIADEGPQEAVDNSNLAKFTGDAHRREDGKWQKPSDWQPPDWDKILAEQGLTPVSADIPVVNDSVVPVGPGDGLRQRLPLEESSTDRAVKGARPFRKKYDNHLCPKCKAPVSDEVVKQLDQRKILDFHCVACRWSYELSAKEYKQGRLVLTLIPDDDRQN